MSLELKYRLSLAGFILGILLTLSGASAIQGSFGSSELIRAGLWQLVPGVVLVSLSGPSFYYFRAQRSRVKTKNEIEIEMLIKSNKKPKG